MGLFLDCLFCSTNHRSDFVPVPYCFDYCSFAESSVALQHRLTSGRVMPPALFFFLRIALTILALLRIHVNFRIILGL